MILFDQELLLLIDNQLNELSSIEHQDSNCIDKIDDIFAPVDQKQPIRPILVMNTIIVYILLPRAKPFLIISKLSHILIQFFIKIFFAAYDILLNNDDQGKNKLFVKKSFISLVFAVI
jgi:hypothetical protein